MKCACKIFLFSLFFAVLISCNSEIHYEEVPIHIIPEPLQIEYTEAKKNSESAVLQLDKRKLKLETGTPNSLSVHQLTAWFNQVGINSSNSNTAVGLIFHLDQNKSQNEHWISITDQEIQIKGGSEEALYHGFQSLMQIFETSEERYIAIPLAEIFDRPRFSYRGMHLDVCRHFFDTEFIKKYIDLLAYHKFNSFHWHLTEDQGWRIEIKKYPKLAEIAAYRDETLIGHYSDQPHTFDNKPYGGYYSHDDIKQVVKYASDRYITIVPEIEMPGHAQAALAAYPELSCDTAEYKVMTKWGISENVFCPTETTFTFLENVIDEVVDLFPGPYIHVGGDECPKTAWKNSEFCQNLITELNLGDEHGLQSYFIRRMEKYINSKGKKIIGWDEILEGGLAPNATVMSWRGEKGGIEAASENHDVIMTPTSNCYFDYYQSEDPEEPLAIGGYLPLKDVYNYEPIPKELPKDKHNYILGTQGNVWTEYIPTEDHLEYMAYPRACAMAEVNWSAKEKRDYQSFTKRLETHFERLERRDVNFANHLSEVYAEIISTPEGNQVSFSTAQTDVKIKYWTDQNSSPQINTGVFFIDSIKELKYAAFKDDKMVSKEYTKHFVHHKGTGTKVAFGTDPNPKYSKLGAGVLFNGIEANPDRFGDSEWVAFDDKDGSLKISFQEETTISRIETAFFHSPPYWIHAPVSIQVSYELGPNDLATLPVFDSIPEGTKKVPITLEMDSINTKFLIIRFDGLDEIPEGSPGAGNRPWLFIDEIKIY